MKNRQLTIFDVLKENQRQELLAGLRQESDREHAKKACKYCFGKKNCEKVVKVDPRGRFTVLRNMNIKPDIEN